MWVLEPVAVALMLLLASGGEVLKCLYRIVGLDLSGLKSVEYPERHGGLFLFAALGAGEQIFNLLQAGLRSDLASLHLVDDVAQLFQELDLLGMGLGELYGFDGLAQLDDARGVPRGVLHQLSEPGALQAETDAQH